MKFRPNIREIPFKLLSIAGKMKSFRGSPRKTSESVKAKHFYFDEINACARSLSNDFISGSDCMIFYHPK